VTVDDGTRADTWKAPTLAELLALARRHDRYSRFLDAAWALCEPASYRSYERWHSILPSALQAWEATRTERTGAA